MPNRTVSVNLVANIGQYVSGMNAAAGATLRLGESATTSTAKAKSGFDLAGKGALLAGAAVVGGLGMAISKSMEFEKAMSAAAAATTASGAALTDLRDAAMKAGADTQYSATEAAQAITEMGKAGVSTADILGGGLNGALSLAAAGQLEVGKAAEIASVAMTQFKLSGDQLPHVADLLAAGAGKAMGSVEDLGMALNQAGLVASSTGISIEETTGTLAAFASAGLIGSDAGTSFRSMLQHLQNPSKESAQKMSELGIAMYDAQGQFVGMESLAGQLQTKMKDLTPAVRDAAMAQIFGSDAVRAANVLYSEGAKGIADWTKKVDDQGFAAKNAAKLTDNLSGDLERLGGSFDTLLISMGSGAQGPLRDLVQGLTTLVDAIGGDEEAFLSLPAPVRLALDAFSGLFDVVTGVADAFGALSGPMQIAVLAAAGWAVAGDRIMGVLRPMGEALGPMRGTWSAFSEALGYARQNGDGLSTVLRSVGDTAGGAALNGIKALGRAIGPELAVATGAFVITSFVSGLQSITQASDEAKAAAEGLAKALTLTDRAADRKSIRTAIEDTEGLIEVLDKAGVSSEDAVNGLLGQESAQRRVTDALRAYKSEVYAPNGGGGDKESKDAREAVLAYEELATGYGTAASNARYFADESSAAAAGATATGEAAAGAAPQIDAVTEAQSKLGETLAQFVDPLGAYTGLLQEKEDADREAAEATAAATESSKDSWEDYVTDVKVSFEEYQTELEKQVAAQANWETNMLMLAGRVSAGTLAELSRMGPEGAPLVAELVSRSDAELAHMDELFAARSQEATDAWGAQLSQAVPVLAAIGKKSGQGVVNELAAQLQAGTTTVAQIAAQYGLTLAGGINPVLTSLGRPTITLSGRMGGMPFYGGGYTGDGGKYEPKGVVHGGEYVLTKEQTSRLGIDQIEAFANSGYAKGGFVTAADVPKPYSTAPYAMPISTAGDATMQKGFDEVTDWMKANATLGGVAGAGAVGGAWGSLWNLVKGQIPQARINSTFRAGDPGYHGRNKAIDFGFGSGPGGAGSAGLASINRLLHDSVGRNLAELIYDGTGDDRPDLKNGKPLTYSAGTRAEHRNHVHAAVYDQGGWLQPGYTMAYNGTGAPERVLTSREFSGSGGGAGGGVMAQTREVRITAVAAPNEQALVRAIVDRQRDLEFLHG